MTGLRLRQNLKLQDTDLESLSHQGFGVAMQLLKHREDAMDVVQDSLRKLVHGGQFNEKLGNAPILVFEGCAKRIVGCSTPTKATRRGGLGRSTRQQ